MGTDSRRDGAAGGPRRPVQALVAGTALALGLALLVFMVTVEGEPGLLPLALVIGGGGWLAWLGIRARARSRG